MSHFKRKRTTLSLGETDMYRFLLALSIICIPLAATANVNVTDLKNNGVKKWEHKVFFGETSYSVNNYKGKTALKAVSNSTGSGLILKKRIDLQKTPL